MKFLILFSFLLTPIFATPFAELTCSVDYWWCKSCGLAYPASQKCCLNKDCPLFRKAK